MRLSEKQRLRRTIRVARRFCDKKVYRLEDIDRDLRLPEGTASQLIKYARSIGLLTVRRDLPLPLDTEVGARLGTAFYPTEMLVIETPRPRRRRATGEEDDRLHEMLGRTAAGYLADRIKNDDMIGVGAGRGCFHAARSLQNFPGKHEKTRHVTVFALHGRTERRFWRDTSRYAQQSVDSLRVSHALATVLPLARSLALHRHLIQPNAAEVREGLEGPASFLTRGHWSRRPPTLALVGLGIMGGPSVVEGSRSGGSWLPAKPEVIKPIRRPLLTLRDICRKFTRSSTTSRSATSATGCSGCRRPTRRLTCGNARRLRSARSTSTC